MTEGGGVVAGLIGVGPVQRDFCLQRVLELVKAGAHLTAVEANGRRVIRRQKFAVLHRVGLPKLLHLFGQNVPLTLGRQGLERLKRLGCLLANGAHARHFLCLRLGVERQFVCRFKLAKAHRVIGQLTKDPCRR